MGRSRHVRATLTEHLRFIRLREAAGAKVTGEPARGVCDLARICIIHDCILYIQALQANQRRREREVRRWK
jgi:hypothetical protein